MSDDKLSTLNVCEEAMKLNDDDFQIFISDLEKNKNPSIQKMCTYLIEIRGA